MWQQVLPVLLSALALALATSANAITFADGLTHVIDATNSLPLDSAEVRDSDSGAPTTLVVTTGGQVAGIVVSGHSIVELTGGWSTGEIEASENSSVSVYSGRTAPLNALDDSSIVLSGGSADSVNVSDRARVALSGTSSDVNFVVSGGFLSISDGTIGGQLRINAAQDAQVSAGTFGGQVLINSATAITGGLFLDDVRSRGGALLTLTGGDFEQVVAAETSTIRVLGGLLGQRDGNIVAQASSAIQLFGSDFNFPLGDISPLSGALAGLLKDGTPLDVSFIRASTATITLVPEPTTVLLLAIGLAGLAAARRRRSLH